MADDQVQQPGHTKYGFRLLNGTNYCTWKTKMSMQLENIKLLKFIRDPAPEHPDEKWIADDSKAITTIGLCLEDNQLKHIHGCNTAREVWTALESEHDQTFTSAHYQQLRLLFNTKWRSGTIEEYIDRMRDIL